MRNWIITSLLSMGAIAHSFTVSVIKVEAHVSASSSFGPIPPWLPFWQTNSWGVTDTSAPFVAMTEAGHWRTDVYQYGGYAWGEVLASTANGDTQLFVNHISRLWVKSQDASTEFQHGRGSASHRLVSEFSVDDWATIQFSTQHLGEILWNGTGPVSWDQQVWVRDSYPYTDSAGAFAGYRSNGVRYHLKPGTHRIQQITSLTALAGSNVFIVYPGYEMQVHETINKRTNQNIALSRYHVFQATMNPVGGLYYNVLAGQYFGGNAQSLAASDNDRLYILCDESAPNATLIIGGYYPMPNTGLKVRFETSSSRNDLVEFFDIIGGHVDEEPTWKPLASGLSSLTDQVRQFHWDKYPTGWNGPPATTSQDYIRPSDGHVQCRIRWIPTQDLESADGWLVSVDEANMYRPQ